ncbi:MAG: response regulator [Gallionella sp.]|nr:response regulator [Gallionella sp.]
MEKKVILLVEDNPDDEELTRLAFEECRVANKLVVVRDGQEALDYLFLTGAYADRDASEVPQVILLDMKLPKLDGLEVLYRVRADERTKLLPVVVLTSSKEEKDIVESYELGANSYIQKPVDYLQFTEVVQQLGLYWLVLNQTVTTSHQ